MTETNWKKKWGKKEITVSEAIAKIIPGNRVFLGTGCSKPQALTMELFKQSERLIDTEIVHFLTVGPKNLLSAVTSSFFRHNSLFIGDSLRQEINEGKSDYTPIYASEIPNLFRTGRRHVDVALIQVTPPDQNGFCSFGINVDITKPISQSSYITIAEINPMMPRTLGHSFIHMKEIDFFIYNETPLLEYQFTTTDEVGDRIIANTSNLIEDGSTIHVGFGDLPNSVLKGLMDKKHLGMHSHYVTDEIIPLILNTVLTCRKKNIHPGKILTSFALGSKKLYDFIDNNPYFEFFPSDYVCNPRFIGKNKKLVSINSARQIDLTGQINASTEGKSFYSGFGETIDFMRGAAFSEGGKPIIIIPSTSRDGKKSRIVSHLDEGAGVMLSRGDVYYVVTEWGVAYLHGKTIRERVIELICIAHPDFRQSLLDEAKKLNYVYPDQILPCDGEGNPCFYPKQYETYFMSRKDERVFMRPVKTTDEELLKDLYYSLDDRDRYLRFFEIKKEFTHSKTQFEVNIDYVTTFSLAALLGDYSSPEMIGIATYHYNPRNNMGEFSFTVKKDWRSYGIGSRLLAHLIMIAKENGLGGFYGAIHIENKSTIRLIQKSGKTVVSPPEAGEKELFFELFFDEDQ